MARPLLEVLITDSGPPSDTESETTNGLSYSSSIADLSEYFKIGSDKFQPRGATHVVHTSTIPYAGTFNKKLAPEQAIEYHHGTLSADCNCDRTNCMFVNQGSYRSPELVDAKCPCLSDEQKLTPVCFMQVLRLATARLSFSAEDAKTERTSLSNISFCPDGVNLFSESYPGYVRDLVGSSGWNATPNEQIINLLDCTYWFKRFAVAADRKLLRSLMGSNFLKSAVFQSIGTIDGLLTKMFLSFGDVIGSYRDIAIKTAKLFGRLMSDYAQSPKPGVTENPDTTYGQIKPFLQAFKKQFHHEDDLVRLRLLEVGLPQFQHINWFFKDVLDRLFQQAMELWRDYEVNSVRSIAWYTRMSMFSKARVIGHVPVAISEVGDITYLKRLSLVVPPPSKEEAALVARAVLDGLRKQKVPRGACTLVLDLGTKDEQAIEDRRDVDLPIKFTADELHTTRQGGKPESGRLLVAEAREKKWDIPIRDLRSGIIVDTFSAPEPGEPGYKKATFWLSLEILLQAFQRRGVELRPEENPRIWETSVTARVFAGTYIRISESGKDRKLCKTSFVINAATMPGSKMLASQLAKAPSHKAGLTGSGHAWRFEQSLGGNNDDAAFMYDDVDLTRLPGIWGGFQDWSDATDHLRKGICQVLLHVAHSYVGFPAFYGDVCRRALNEEVLITKKKTLTVSEDGVVYAITTAESAVVRNGTMMGSQNCKNVLHLVHFAEESLTEKLVASLFGCKRVQSVGFGTYLSTNLVPFMGKPFSPFEATSV